MPRSTTPTPPTPPDVSSHITQLTATLTDAQSGALEYLILTDAGHTIATNNSLAITGENTGTLMVTGSATDTVYQDLLREIRYVNTDTSVGLNPADRHVTVQVQDGVGANSNIATATIAIEHGNHDPVIDLGWRRRQRQRSDQRGHDRCHHRDRNRCGRRHLIELLDHRR